MAASKDETWDTLYAAARDVLRDTGPEFSMRHVARAAGHRLATLQHYFPRKADVLEAVLGESYRRVAELVEGLEPAIASGRDPAEVTAELVVALYRFGRAHRQLCRVRMASNLVAGQMSRASVHSLRAGVMQVRRTLPGELDERALTLAIHALSVLTLRYAAHPPEELAALLETRTEGQANLLVEQHLTDLARHLTREVLAGVSAPDPRRRTAS